MRPAKMTVTVPVEIQALCLLLGITPIELLETFMSDLASCNNNQGSDERMMAKEWFLRGGISSSAKLDYEEVRIMVEEFDDFPRRYDENKTQKERRLQLNDWFKKWGEKTIFNNSNKPK